MSGNTAGNKAALDLSFWQPLQSGYKRGNQEPGIRTTKTSPWFARRRSLPLFAVCRHCGLPFVVRQSSVVIVRHLSFVVAIVVILNKSNTPIG